MGGWEPSPILYHPANQDVRRHINSVPIEATGAVYVMVCENESCRSSACQLPWTPSNMAGGKRNNLMSQVSLRLYYLTYGPHTDDVELTASTRSKSIHSIHAP